MRVLVACECSGVVREAFRSRGHEAWSADIKPAEDGGPHIQGDVLAILDHGWDLMIAHPPCTHLSVSGARHFAAKIADGRQQSAVEFFRAMLGAPIPRVAVENPVGIVNTTVRPPDQIIQPYQFGDRATKTTCLWLRGLPPLLSFGGEVAGRGEHITFKSGKRMSKWMADALRLSPEERSTVRSRTFPGIAAAMADQWGSL